MPPRLSPATAAAAAATAIVYRLLSQRPISPGRKRPFFECFPYVCPEPVLVKKCILYINGAKKDTFSHLGFDDLSQIIEHPTLLLSLLLTV